MPTATDNFIPRVRDHVGTIVVGQDEVVERVLIALLTSGHLLLQGVPGLAKTLLVMTIARAIDLEFNRIQCTVDMLPSDITGSEVLDQKTLEYHTHQGPVFTNLLLADEINRASPKVQSALLESMQEKRVTIGGKTMRLPTPFLVIATQNPVEQAGTFELPEAQLDRFMLFHRLDYPTPEEEEEVLRRQLHMGLRKEKSGGAIMRTAFDMIEDTPQASAETLTQCMEDVQKVHVSDVFVKHCVELVNKTRKAELLEFGCSPRAGLSLINASRARAYIHERDFVTPEDMFELAEDVMLHRMRLTYEAQAEGHTTSQVLQKILADLS